MNEERKPELTLFELCEDVRQEVGGKLSLMGLLMREITLPGFPHVLPSLTMVARWDDGGGKHQISLQLIDPDEKPVPGMDTQIDVEFRPDRRRTVVWHTAKAVEIPKEGQYRLVTGLGGQQVESIAYGFAKAAVAGVTIPLKLHPLEEEILSLTLGEKDGGTVLPSGTYVGSPQPLVSLRIGSTHLGESDLNAATKATSALERLEDMGLVRRYASKRFNLTGVGRRVASDLGMRRRLVVPGRGVTEHPTVVRKHGPKAGDRKEGDQ